jgi:hypothetical protein
MIIDIWLNKDKQSPLRTQKTANLNVGGSFDKDCSKTVPKRARYRHRAYAMAYAEFRIIKNKNWLVLIKKRPQICSYDGKHSHTRLQEPASLHIIVTRDYCPFLSDDIERPVLQTKICCRHCCWFKHFTVHIVWRIWSAETGNIFCCNTLSLVFKDYTLE